MLQSLKLIHEVKLGNRQVLRDHRWLQFLYLTREKRVNLEQVESLKEIPDNPVLQYVEKTLWILNDLDLPPLEKGIIEEVLIWSEVAKGGMHHQRKKWKEKGFQLDIHNIGSAQIYADEKMKEALHTRNLEREEFIYTLIATHGLVGQYIRGEIRYTSFQPLLQWIKESNNTTMNLIRILYHLNQCIVEAVSPAIWKSIQYETEKVLNAILQQEKNFDFPLKERLKKLRKASIQQGEDFEREYVRLMAPETEKVFDSFFKKIDVWYVEIALQDFTFEEFLKIFLLIYHKVNPLTIQHVSFEPFMRDMYYDYRGKKSINLYKKRMIESYLREFSIEELLVGKIPKNEHVELDVKPSDPRGEIVNVSFNYSKAGEKLIEFCQEAEKSPLYERAIILLYDFFGFRKDAYDRLQNEKTYLTDMNNAHKHKRIISEYAVGNTIVDVGAGGGVMLDILSEDHPHATVIGIDVATNVIEELNRRKFRENKKWLVKKADALNLKKDFEPNSVDTIVFSSVLHELFSYIPFKGKKFNIEVVIQALKSSFEVLRPGGRIIIRDGIMTEPKEQLRLLEFLTPDGMDFFKRYVKDFKGRKIQYEQISERVVKLPVNDLMEFCYTYTWGEEAYPHEVQEQFGYFTPSEYQKSIKDALGEQVRILHFSHYLQDGYEKHLLPKIRVMDEHGNVVRLPDSTCFIVIEKKLQ